MMNPIMSKSIIKGDRMLGMESRIITCDSVFIQIRDRIRMIERQYDNCFIDEFRRIEKLKKVKVMVDELFICNIIDDVMRD